MLVQDLHEKRKQAQDRFLNYENALRDGMLVRNSMQHSRDMAGDRQGDANVTASLSMGSAASVRQLAALDVGSSSQNHILEPDSRMQHSRSSKRRSASVPLILSRVGGHGMVSGQSQLEMSACRIGRLPPLGINRSTPASTANSSAWSGAEILNDSASYFQSISETVGPTQRQPHFMPLADYDDAGQVGGLVDGGMFEKWKAEGREVHATSKWLDKSTGEFVWKGCTVLNYDRKSELFMIQWHCNGSTKLVTRLNLFFESEDRQRLNTRIEQAKRMRNEVEYEMRYAYRLDHMPNGDDCMVPSKTMLRICQKIGIVKGHSGQSNGVMRWVLDGAEHFSPPECVLSGLQQNVIAKFAVELGAANAQAFNKLSFDEIRKANSKEACFCGLSRDTDNDFDVRLMNHSNVEIVRLEYPYKVVDMPLDDVLRSVGGRLCLQSFEARVDFIERNWSRGNERIMGASFTAWSHIQHLSQQSFMSNVRQMRPRNLYEFLKMQRDACTETQADLRTLIRFELPDLIEDKYGEEDIYMARDIELEMQRQYRRFQNVCKQMLRAITLKMFDEDLAAFVDLCTREDSDDSNPLLLIAFDLGPDSLIQPQIPLNLYREGLLNCFPMIGNCLLSIQDLVLKFLPLDPASTDQLNTGELQAALRLHGIFLSKAKVAALATTIDADGDGTVTIDEFLVYIKEEEGKLQDIWKSMDADEGGTLDFEELQALMRHMGKSMSERKLHKAFRKIDQDNSGVIEYEEFIDWWRSQAIKSAADAAGDDDDDDDDFLDETDLIMARVANYALPKMTNDTASASTINETHEAIEEHDLPKLHPDAAYFRSRLRSACALVQASVDRDINRVHHLHATILAPFQELLQTDVESFKASLLARMRWQSIKAQQINQTDPEPSEVCDNQLQKLDGVKTSAENAMEQNLNCGIFKSIITPTIEKVFSMCTLLSDITVNCLKQAAIGECERLHAEMQAVLQRLEGNPTSVEEYADLKKFIDDQLRDNRFPTEYNVVMKSFETVESHCRECSDLEVQQQWTGFQIANNLDQQLVVRKRNLHRDAKTLLTELEGKEETLRAFAEKLLQKVMDYAQICAVVELEQSDAFVLAKMRENLVESVNKDKLYRHHRATLMDAQDELPSLLSNELLGKAADVELWNQAATWFTHFHAWMATPFNQLNATRTSQKVDQFLATNHTTMAMIKNTYKGSGPVDFVSTHPVTISVELQERIVELHTQMPFVVALRHPGIRTRHWIEIEEIVGYDIRGQLDQCLADVLLLDFGGKKSAMHEVLKRAIAEYKIEESLDHMLSELEQLRFQLIHFLNETICEQTGVEAILSVIDRQFVAMQAVMLSPHIAPFEDRAHAWISYLCMLQDFTDLLKENQKLFLYFLPVFTAPEASTIIPNETSKFVEIKEKFGSVIMSLNANPILAHVLPARPELQILLQQCLILFDGLRGGMPILLDSKRQQFSRLYFMSDRDLMDMMSKTSNELHLLGEYVNKCFGGISELLLSARQDAIEAICSDNGEKLFLEKHVPISGLPVETWMAALEKEMRSSLSLITKQAVASVTDIKIDRRLFDWPVESTIVAHEVFFTKVTERAIGSGKVEMLRVAHDGVVQKISTFSSEMRVLLGADNLTATQRITRTAQLLLLLKFRDNLSELICNDVIRLDDFVWKQNLRYYYGKDNSCTAKCALYSQPYGFEYTGGKARLVMTDATKKAVGTILGAMHYSMGCAVMGQPACGKSSIIADVAAALGRPFVSFSCEEALAPDSLTNMMRGMAATAGAWICLDNFNMLSYETMSTMAQYVLNVQRASAARKTKVLIGEVAVPLRGSTGIAVSLVSSSWTDGTIHDNVKSLFRPVALTLPSSRKISEAYLVSAGFSFASDLAMKLDCCFYLLNYHTHRRVHYDFGLWSIMAVLRQAVQLRNKELTGTRHVASSELDAITDDDRSLEFSWLIRAADNCIKPGLADADLSLYSGVMEEVFTYDTSTSAKSIDLDDLAKAAVKALQLPGLDVTPALLQETANLHGLQGTRNGIILVGEEGCGKTTCYRVVHKMLQLQGADIVLDTINPKALAQGTLCGIYNKDADKWNDGVLTKILHRHINARSAPSMSKRRWIVLDGTLQGEWTDIFMSILDDTRTLCLTNGERIRLHEDASIFFEVTSLRGATPSLVSRCATQFFQPSSKPESSTPKVMAWLEQLDLPVPHKVVLQTKVEGILAEAIDYVSGLPCPIPVVGSGYADSFIGIMNGLLQKHPELKKNGDVQCIKQNMEVLFAFSVVWALGGHLHSESRVNFDNFVDDALGSISVPIPTEWSVFDAWFDFHNKEWKLWTEADSYFQRPIISSLDSIGALIVPTASTNYVAFMSDLMSSVQRSLLVCGEDATGKSSSIVEGLRRNPMRAFQRVPLCWSTPAEVVQRAVERKLERKQAVREDAAPIFGPIAHGTSLMVIVEDLHAPEPDLSGTRSPNEYVRQLLDHRGCYHTKDLEWCRYNNVHINATQGTTGGKVSARLTRHFFILYFPSPADQIMESIFKQCIHATWNMSDELIELAFNPLVKLSVQLYRALRQTFVQDGHAERQHYQFGMFRICNFLRSLICIPESSQPTTPSKLVRLWVHELVRSLRDGLSRPDDRLFFDQQLLEATQAYIKPKYTTSLADADAHGQAKLDVHGMLYTNLFTDDSEYAFVDDRSQLQTSLAKQVEQIDGLQTIVCDDVARAVVAVTRLLTNQSNCILLGMHFGRRDICQIAAAVNGYKFREVSMQNWESNCAAWRRTIQECLHSCVAENKLIMLYIKAAHGFDERFIVDIDILLHGSMLQHFFPTEDYNEQLDMINQELPNANAEQTFQNRAAKNLRIILSCPEAQTHGGKFAKMVARYPRLSQACDVKWCDRWSEESLETVAAFTCKDLRTICTEKEARAVEKLSLQMYTSMRELATRYCAETSKHVFVSVSLMIEFGKYFEVIYTRKEKEISSGRDRLAEGLAKMDETAKVVFDMQEEIDQLLPKLAKTRDEMDDLMESLAEETKIAEIARTALQEEEIVIEAERKEANAISADARSQLDEALPELSRAAKYLDSISKSDIVEIRSMNNPPETMTLVMEALCILLGRKPRRVADPNGGWNKVDDYWAEAKVLLQDTEILNKLKAYDKDNIPEENIMKLTPYIKNPKFVPKEVARISNALKSICAWIRAMFHYYHILQEVKPKQLRLEEAQRILRAKEEQLRQSKHKLDVIEAKIKALEQSYRDGEARKKYMEDKMVNLQDKFSRASKLLDEVSGERERWGQRVRSLSGQYQNLVGDIALATATVTYLGAVSPAYRSQMLPQWMEQIAGHELHFSTDFQLGIALSSETTIREWSLAGLPTDPESLTSATILMEAIRVPLIMDPQGYAVTWFKKLGFCTSTHMEDAEFERKLQQCLSTGTALIIDGIDGFDTHPIILSLLKRIIIDVEMRKTNAAKARQDRATKENKTKDETHVVKPHILVGEDRTPILFHEKFRLYFTSTEDHPSYAAVFSAKVNIINFTLTFEALEAKLVDTLVEKDAPSVEIQRKQLQQEDLELHKELEIIEDKILYQLASAKGDVLEDDDLLEMLSELTTESKAISAKMTEVQTKALQIRSSRDMYLPVAHRSSLVFFSLLKLFHVSPMYNFGLNLFISLFSTNLFADARLSLDERLEIMINRITLAVYRTVCRSIQRRDALMFAFILSHTLHDVGSTPEWALFLSSVAPATATRAGTIVATDANDVDRPEWIPPHQWQLIGSLGTISRLKDLQEHISVNEGTWKDAAHTPPERDQHQRVASHMVKSLPGEWSRKLSPIQKFCLCSFLNQDRILEHVYDFVGETLGTKFLTPNGYDLLRSYEDSQPSTAVIMVMEKHLDPTTEVLEFATERGMSFSSCQVFPCPQVQSPHTTRLEKKIRDSVHMGGWIILQNCHLGLAWLPWLARLLDTTAKHSMHSNFRVWLLTLPAGGFPVSLLSNGIKVMYEHPNDFQTSMTQ
eukprot:SAG31_NODE_1_length_62978_cov_30.836130_10_plen_3970_part_00